jgi:hypothetical protein
MRRGGSGRGRQVVLGLAVAVACMTPPLTAADASAAGALAAPPGFRLSASNGYTIRAFAFYDREGDQDAFYLFVTRKHSAVFYFTKADVTEASIRADLGAVGRVDVHFVPTGRSRTERSACGGKPVKFDAGFYEGAIVLEGEERYMHADATRARGEVRTVLSLLCPGGADSEGSGGHSPGALMTVRQKLGSTKMEFVARKNSPTRSSKFQAAIDERRGRLSISRAVSITGSARAFRYDVAARMATVRPAFPFSGKAAYHAAAGSPGGLFGDLTVDFPGRSGVRLTGARTRAALVRAVQNPSHPFRVPRLAQWPSTNL